MYELEEYQNQDIFNPKYLFHGTAHEIEKLECRKSLDSENKDKVFFNTVINWLVSI